MTRYRGQITGWEIDRKFPYQVELKVPEGGFGKRTDGMYAFCRGSEYATRAVSRRPEFFSRWCFKDKERADQFYALFGGTRIDIDVQSL